MLEALGEPLGPLGGLLVEARGHGTGDGQELGLDARPDATGTPRDQGVQTPDRPLEPPEGAFVRLPVLLADREPVIPAPDLEVDDLTHACIVDRGSDTTAEARVEVVLPVVVCTPYMVQRTVGGWPLGEGDRR